MTISGMKYTKVDEMDFLTLYYMIKAEVGEKATVPPALKNPNVLTIKMGDTTYTYDGSEPITIEIPST